MPIYEFECPGCGMVKEIRTATFSSGLTCAKCNLEMVKKVSPFSFTLTQPSSKVIPGARPVRR